MKLDPVDVVVVGAGMGGAAFCARLSEQAPRLRIVCLERGGWVDTAAMPAWRRDWQRAAFAEWATSPNLRLKAPTRSLSADYPIDDSGSPIKPLMWNGVGGSTINWAAHFPRLHPSDFRTRTLDGVGDDWPFDYFDLEPYYDLNDAAMGVSGRAGQRHHRRRGEAAGRHRLAGLEGEPMRDEPSQPFERLRGRVGAAAAGAADDENQIGGRRIQRRGDRAGIAADGLDTGRRRAALANGIEDESGRRRLARGGGRGDRQGDRGQRLSLSACRSRAGRLQAGLHFSSKRP